MDLQTLVVSALPEDTILKPLSGFKMDLSAHPEFDKAFFSTRCDCGTAALLSVEIDRNKTLEEVTAALPSLVDRLEMQCKSFHDMSCDAHRKMQIGRVAQK